MACYGLIAYTSYSKELKASPYYFLIGLVGALVANLIWLWISKTETDTNQLMIKGLFWDSALTLIYLIVPLMIFEARLSTTQWVGLGLVLIGLTVTKL